MLRRRYSLKEGVDEGQDLIIDTEDPLQIIRKRKLANRVPSLNQRESVLPVQFTEHVKSMKPMKPRKPTKPMKQTELTKPTKPDIFTTSSVSALSDNTIQGVMNMSEEQQDTEDADVAYDIQMKDPDEESDSVPSNAIGAVPPDPFMTSTQTFAASLVSHTTALNILLDNLQDSDLESSASVETLEVYAPPDTESSAEDTVKVPSSLTSAELSDFHLTLSLWCNKEGIKRRSYESLLEVLRLLNSEEV
ncbi:hypothetical protein MMC24_007965 [Lignoscripta atroalba]|nr:hypothetical protein [Lignoscripta atroalba]